MRHLVKHQPSGQESVELSALMRSQFCFVFCAVYAAVCCLHNFEAKNKGAEDIQFAYKNKSIHE